jgi:dTDP-4-amino-4,6-dideoxygalactose transaminase
MKVPFQRLETIHLPLESDFINILTECIKSNQFILGQYVSKFEEEFAIYSGTKYAIGVASGVDALKISLLSLGIGVGDEVIVPAHTFIATWFAVSEIGAIPIPVDVEEESMNIDFRKIESQISIRTKAILPVHLYGMMANMDELEKIAKKHKLFLVEDFAQAHGSIWKGRKSGSIGHINASSFYPGKNLGAFGDAGIITTNDEKLAKIARTLRNNGSIKKNVHNLKGFNSRLDNIQAGFLLVKLKFLNQWNEERNLLVDYYKSKLMSINSISFQSDLLNEFNAIHLFVIKCQRRDELKSFLLDNGVETIIHYPIPPYKQVAYKYMNTLSFYNSENICNRILSLPLYPGLSKKEIDYVCDLIIRFFETN